MALPLSLSPLCIDGEVIEGALNLGAIVLVEINSKGQIAEFVSAYMRTREAYDARNIDEGNNFVYIFPGETRSYTATIEAVRSVDFATFIDWTLC